MTFIDLKKSLPALGVGLGLRREMAHETFAHADAIDWLEFVPENYMGLGGAATARMEQAQSLFPMISHGVNLSIGSVDDLNQQYLKSIKTLLHRVDSAWWSDHLCFTRNKGFYLHDLLPLPFTKEAVDHIAKRVKHVQDFVEKPFLLENISFYMYMPGNEMTEAQFLSELLEKADCGLLLDVNNVYVNSVNHNFDPYEFLSQLPLDRTVQIHVAGHSEGDEMVIDTHGAPVVEPVFKILQWVLARTDVKAVMIERDQNFPAFTELLNEISRIRDIARETQPSMLPVKDARYKLVKSQALSNISPVSELSGGRIKGRESVSLITA